MESYTKITGTFLMSVSLRSFTGVVGKKELIQLSSIKNNIEIDSSKNFSGISEIPDFDSIKGEIISKYGNLKLSFHGKKRGRVFAIPHIKHKIFFYVYNGVLETTEDRDFSKSFFSDSIRVLPLANKTWIISKTKSYVTYSKMSLKDYLNNIALSNMLGENLPRPTVLSDYHKNLLESKPPVDTTIPEKFQLKPQEAKESETSIEFEPIEVFNSL